MKFKYKIKSENTNPEETIIEKTGQVLEFTPAELKANLDYAFKQKKEIQAQWGINEATKENIKRTHPHVAKMSEEDLTAAYLYRQAMGSANECQDKLLELDDAIKEDYQALIDACEQTGLEIEYKIPEGFEIPEHNHEGEEDAQS